MKTSVAMARAGIDKIPTRLPGIRIIAELLFSLSFAGLIAFQARISFMRFCALRAL